LQHLSIAAYSYLHQEAHSSGGFLHNGAGVSGAEKRLLILEFCFVACLVALGADIAAVATQRNAQQRAGEEIQR
jgi:hypothetical protein